MRTGAVNALREMMVHAMPWQRAMIVIVIVIVAGGVAMLNLGQRSGLVVIAVIAVFVPSSHSRSSRVRGRGR
jgi:uncharacterized membrane protein